MRVGYCKELSTTRVMYKYGIRKKSEYISKKQAANIGRLRYGIPCA